MNSNHNDQPTKGEAIRNILGTAGNFNSSYSRQEKIKVDLTKSEVRQTTEDLKARLRELLFIRFLS